MSAAAVDLRDGATNVVGDPVRPPGVFLRSRRDQGRPAAVCRRRSRRHLLRAPGRVAPLFRLLYLEQVFLKSMFYHYYNLKMQASKIVHWIVLKIPYWVVESFCWHSRAMHQCPLD